MWGRNKNVVIIPSFLAFAFLGASIHLDSLAGLDLLPIVIWMAAIGANFIEQDLLHSKYWGYTLTLTSLTASMTVNALVTGLIVFKIFKVFREVKSVTTSEDKSFGITRRNKLHSVPFIIIESGMALFVMQLARVAISATLLSTDAENDAFQFICRIHEMVNVDISSVILTLCILTMSI